MKGWKIVIAIFAVALSLGAALPLSTAEAQAVGAVTIDFNDLLDKQFLGTRYPGLNFSPEWRAADMRTGQYNTEGYPPHSWPIQIWTGTSGQPEPWSNTGRIDFDFSVKQVAGWFCADYGTVYLEAYDAGGTLVDSETLGSNYGSNTYLSVGDPQGRIRYVIIHDSANYWTMDDFEYTRALGVEITIPSEGNTFWIEAEPEPRMPTINCKAKVIGIDPDPTATIEFSWEAVVTYTDHGRNDVHRFESGKVTGGAWIPDFKNVIAGGSLTIKVKAVIDGKEYQDSVTGYIRGRNPNKGTVKDTLGELILQVICYKESFPKWYQFDSSGLPVFGPPGGFGLMQLDTPPPTTQQIWSWLENAKGGRTMWREKVAMSKNYVKRVKKANADQKVTNLSHEQHERQAAYLYRGAAWVDGEWQYYYAWNRDAKQWEVNPKAGATSKVYADDAMNTKAAVLAGNPPPGW